MTTVDRFIVSARTVPGDVERVQRAFAFYGRQAEFAHTLALNDVGRQIQAATRGALRRGVTVRTDQAGRWLDQLIRIPRGGFATRARPRVEVEIRKFDDFSRASILPGLVTGARETMGRLGPFATPTVVLGRPGSSVIPQRYYPRALGVLERRGIDGGVVFGATARRTDKRRRVRKAHVTGPVRTKSGKWLIRGKERTFAIDPRFHPGQPANRYGVYLRLGPGSNDIVKIWHYQLTRPVPQRLDFGGIARRIAATEYAPAFDRGLARALATAR